jgi:glycosyltransferase involved in cell wall biosynthesis
MGKIKNVIMIVYANYVYDSRVRREAEALAKSNKFCVTVLGLKDTNVPKSFFLNGVQVFELNEKKYFGTRKLRLIYSYFKFLAIAFIKCTRLFLKNQLDIVHVHNMPDFLVLAAIIPRVFGRKLVIDIHDTMPETYFDKYIEKSRVIFKFLCIEEALCAALSNKVISVNHVQKEILIKRGISPEKIVISMNVPDPVFFDAHLSNSKIEPKSYAFNMVYHGTIAWRLGVDLIIRAVEKLINNIDGLQFHLWSKSCPNLDTIEQLIKSLNIENHVTILRGGVPLERLANELKRMNVGIVGNRKGNATDLMLPVKMLEYIYLEIPVVAPRLKCIQEYFSEAMVSFYEPGNLESMVSAILALYYDPGRGNEQARQAKTFFDRYGWKNHKHDLIRMYDNLIGEKAN